MQRRRFLARLSQALVALGVTPALARADVRMPGTPQLHLQDCHIAGSHYYDCRAVLGQLRPGDPLHLRRQPDNPRDERAIEVFWRQHKLGYLPRMDNAAAASLIDRSHALRAEILAVSDPAEAWEPVWLRVWLER